MNWNDLYTLFTAKIGPVVRRRVLEAIADAEQKIITGKFYGDGGGCLFALAAMSCSLGLSESQIVEGVRLWDSDRVKPRWCFPRNLRKNKADLCRARFRERIRRHLEQRDRVSAVEILKQLPA